MIIVFKKCCRTVLPVLISSVICIMIIANSSTASQAIINGLKICSSVVIPSLFPFMLISGFIVKSGIHLKIGKIIGKPLGFIFNLAPCSAGAIIMGFIGGYPIGAAMTSELFKLGDINQAQAKRMALFTVNAGPAFIISAVGEAIYKSKDIGYILFLSVVLSSLTTGIFTGIYSRIKREKAEEKPAIRSKAKISAAFVESTEGAARAVMMICVWIITFGVIIGFVNLLPMPKEIQTLLSGVLEVTSGCTLSAGILPIPVTAAIISFSGFCIFFQIMPHIKFIGMKFSALLLSRATGAFLSFIYCSALIHIFPNSTQVFGNSVTPLAQSFSVSIPTTICLILTCALLIFEVDRSKKVC